MAPEVCGTLCLVSRVGLSPCSGRQYHLRSGWLQILGQRPLPLGQQSDDVGAGTGLGSLRPGSFSFWKHTELHHWVADVSKGLEEEVQGSKDSVDTNSGGD